MFGMQSKMQEKVTQRGKKVGLKIPSENAHIRWDAAGPAIYSRIWDDRSQIVSLH